MNSNESRGIITKSIVLKNNFKSLHQRQYNDFMICGGTFSNFELSWQYKGPILKIIDTVDGTVVSNWDFTTITHDSRTEITNVIEYSVREPMNRNSGKENQLYFIVSYISKKDLNKASFISVCHPRASRILHTITTKEKITCLSLITTRKDHSSPISGVVKLMCGALAAGTKSGNILIIDIKEIFSCVRQGCLDRVQNRFSEMVIVDKHNESVIKEKLNKMDEFHHAAVSLPVSEKKDAEPNELEITVIKYIPECTMLAVGLRNGSFQLWDVCTLRKLYKSSGPRIATPVVKFGFQEPCNDPQSFCYLWVVHESQTEESICLPFAVMYACLFKKMTPVPEYGRHYKNFMHCKKRFDLDVDLERCINGRCIACSVVSNTPSNILRHVTSIEEDASKINLFVTAFETWEQESGCNSCITLVIFDMNQWYKAQMPQLVYQSYAVPFVNFQVLDHISERKGTVLHMSIKKDTIQQFLSFNLSEEYSYPSSLSFDTLFLTDLKLIHVRVPGAQQNVLDKIVTEGPSCIMNPSKYFSECREVGLRPFFSDTFTHVVVPSQLQQRNLILTVLLEQKLSSFLVACVKQWADGSRGVSGCTLPNFIRWAWECVTRIKQLTDTICIPLFDYSGDDLDRENYQKLKHCVQLMHTIKELLAYILKNYKQYLLEDVKLKHQVETLKLITKYFDVIIWCLDSNLLPEKVTSSSEKCVPTYMMSLIQYTEQRRDELRKIVNKDQYFITGNATLYMIDSILEHETNGKKMRAQWEREGGDISKGLYPPVTLQSLLRMFLMPNLSDDAKHFIMIYFLLDVCDYHRDEDMKEQLLSFCVVFSIDVSFFSLIKACWLVDHEKYDDVPNLLFIDSVVTQLQSRRELYRTLMLACVCQGQYRLALRIERLANLSSTVFSDDTFYITLLLLNGLVMEAYSTLKENMFGRKALMRHFFKVCDNLGFLKEVFKFPLSTEEEEEFVTYLDNCDNKDAGDLKIMYLLSRGRYVEAIDVNHQLGSMMPKFGVIGQDTMKQKTGVGRTTTRDLLVNAFSKTLPAVTNDLINFCRKEKDKITRFKTVAKPTPLSVVVHTDTSHQIPVYKSSFESVVEAAMCKTAETWTNVPEILRNKRSQLNLKNTPFLRSDFVTPRKNATSFVERERPAASEGKNQTNKDPAEPSTKRRRLNASMAADNSLDELTGGDTITASPPAEVSKILCTPHVQKRLNKLLQNTPESSPLTSILKSAESKFKQPQKVGFSVPEIEHRRSVRTRINMSPLSSSHTSEKELKTSSHELGTQKPASPEKLNVSLNDSLNTTAASTAMDSFYSLDSDTDNAAELDDFMKESGIRTPSKFIVECMSEEETPQPSHTTTFTIECMSEEDTPQPIRTSPKHQVESVREIEAMQFSQQPSLVEGVHESRLVQVEVHVESPSETDDVCQLEISCVRSMADVSLPNDEIPSFAPLQPLQEAPLKTDEEGEAGAETSIRQEFSIDTYEHETVVGQHSSVSQNTITEVQDTDSEDDSDIEVVSESIPAKHAEDDQNDLSTEANDDSSEEMYDSDYSYSQGSVKSKSGSEEELQEVEIGDEEASIEEAADSDEEIEESSRDVQDLSDEEADDEEDEEDEKEISDHSDIDFDSLKNIMSAVNAAQAEQTQSQEDEPLSATAFNSETNTSVCEVFDVTSSSMVVEQTINVDSTFSSPNNASIIEEVNQSQNISVEMLSVSCVEREKAAEEPQMVFYFGENSVTSIGEELLSDELTDRSNENIDTTADAEGQKRSESQHSEEAKSPEGKSKEYQETKDGSSQRVEDISMVAAREEQSEFDASKIAKPSDGVQEEMAEQREDFSIVTAIQRPSDSENSEPETSDVETVVSGGAGERSRRRQNVIEEMLEEQQVEVGAESDASEVSECDEKLDETRILSQSENVAISVVEEIVGEVTRRSDDFSITTVVEEQGETAVKDNSEESEAEIDVSSVQCTKPMNTSPSPLRVASPKYDSQETPPTPQGTPETRVSSLQLTSLAQGDSVEAEPLRSSPKPALIANCSPVQPALLKEDEHLPSRSSAKTENNSPIPEDDDHPPLTTPISSSKTTDSDNVVKSNVAQRLSPSPRRITRTPEKTSLVGSPVRVLLPNIYESPSKLPIRVLQPSFHESPSKSPVAKAESVCSFTMSIPDSPVDVAPSSPLPEVTQTPSRRSARIARKRSTDSIPQAVASEKAPPRAHSTRKRSTDSTTTFDNDDAASMKSDVSVAESAISRASSTKSSSRKRSFSRLEMRKSSVKPKFKQLEVIMSDEEEKTPAKHVNAQEGDDSEDERLSSVSEASRSQRSGQRGKLNKAVLFSPSPPPKRGGSRKFVVSTPIAPTKKQVECAESTAMVRDYADSRRLTRHQKSLLEYGITRLPQRAESPAATSTQPMDEEQDLVTTASDVVEAEPTEPQAKETKRSTVRARASTRMSKKSTKESGRLDEAAVAAGSDSSDDSTCSKASSALRRSRGSRSTYTNLELRKSSVRPQFRSLAVIQSDDESQPRTPRKSFAGDESVQSSPRSLRSQTTRSMIRLVKNESEVSDHGESSMSDISGHSSRVTRQMRRSSGTEEPSQRMSITKRKAVSPAVSDEPSNEKRSTKVQKAAAVESKGQKRR